MTKNPICPPLKQFIFFSSNFHFPSTFSETSTNSTSQSPFLTFPLISLTLTRIIRLYINSSSISLNKIKIVEDFSLSLILTMATQNVLVMRHGDRLDNFEELWVMKADRPWDPPLHQDGKIRPFCTGQKIRSNMDFPIHRVFVSPFLRCVQTAAEVVRALCDVADHNCEANVLSSNSESVVIDPSKIKVNLLTFSLFLLNFGRIIFIYKFKLYALRM